jgi:hypothetical protein
MKLSKVSDIFIIKYGNSLSLSDIDIDKDNNEINFISRTEKNNGISAKVSMIDNVKINPENTISVAVGGSVLSSFLQENPYYTGYHVLTLHPKTKLTTNEMLYYCMCLKANKYKYSYGRQANKTLNDLLVPALDCIPKWVNKTKIKIPSKESITNKKFELNIENWKYFIFSDIFYIKKGNTPKNKSNGGVRLVSATSLNNGCSKVVSSLSIPNNEGVITVSSNGAVGDAFYQNKDFFATGDVNILTPKFNLTPYIAMFLNTIIKKEKFRFNYGRKWGKEKMLTHKIKLPINENNNPDWEFMENYIKSLPYSKSL